MLLGLDSLDSLSDFGSTLAESLIELTPPRPTSGHCLGCLGFTNLVLDVTGFCLELTVTGALLALSQLSWVTISLSKLLWSPPPAPPPPPLPGSAPSS